MKKWNYKYEFDSLNIFYDWISDPVRKKRISSNIIWAFTKARKYLILHILFLISIVLFNASIPILIELSNCNMPFSLLITLFSFFAALLTAIKEGLKTKELWLNYRFSLEFAKSESMKCYNKVEKYNKSTQEENEQLLCETLEEFVCSIAFNAWKKTFEVNIDEK